MEEQSVGLIVLGAVKDIVVALAAAGSVGAAWLGLNSWRKQLKVNSEYELSRRLLRAVFKTREAIRQLRNPFISAAEFEGAAKEAGVEIGNRMGDIPSMGAVYDSRWKLVSQAVLDFQVEVLEAEVLWGSAIKDKVNGLYQCVRDLKAAIFLHFTYMKNASGISAERQLQIEETINEREDDEFNKKLQEAITEIENFLKPHLKIS